MAPSVAVGSRFPRAHGPASCEAMQHPEAGRSYCAAELRLDGEHGPEALEARSNRVQPKSTAIRVMPCQESFDSPSPGAGPYRAPAAKAVGPESRC